MAAPSQRFGNGSAGSLNARSSLQAQLTPVHSVAESSAQRQSQGDGANAPAQSTKKKRHRAGKKRKTRRQSFAPPSETHEDDIADQRASLEDVPEGVEARSSSFYKVGNRAASETSLESEALLDHRDASPKPRIRRPSIQQMPRSAQSHLRQSTNLKGPALDGTKTLNNDPQDSDEYSDDEQPSTDRTPLLDTRDKRSLPPSRKGGGYGGTHSQQSESRYASRPRRPSATSAKSRPRMSSRHMSNSATQEEFDINNPPSVPNSPRSGPQDDVTLPTFSPSATRNRETIIDIDNDLAGRGFSEDDPEASPRMRRQMALSPVEDVCLPYDNMTEVDESIIQQEGDLSHRRSRKRAWPDLSALEEWSHDEKEERSSLDGVRAKKVNEPVFIDGRLRPKKGRWSREEEDDPFRFCYFNEELDSSLRSHTISGLQQLGLNFRELFIPDLPEIDDTDSEDDDGYGAAPDRVATPVNGQSRAATRQSSILEPRGGDRQSNSGEHTPSKTASRDARPKKYGPRPVFWLDVLQPTYEEMRVLSRTFGIHKLTAEDIMEQEAREKVELFRNYYFVNYRTFEQDETSEDFMDPVNMYFVVFKGGVISFHFSQMPHPPNVRRRIRQLAEHQYTDSDWISYAIIDNITDAYAPLIEQIEKEVDDIDDAILRLHSHHDEAEKDGRRSSTKSQPGKSLKASFYEKFGEKQEGEKAEQSMGDMGRDMLLRVGECRKRVMGLYRLLGNKADVIKGLAKRCNEQWQVAPRSDVGLYLGDIQDHIVTMTANLTHYENILSRAHSNYLAQINIGMNERAEQTADVLGKLTVLGTIVLPMNIITGMWGMNTWVPGQGTQETGDLTWFLCITAGLLVFGVGCFFIAKKVYGIV